MRWCLFIGWNLWWIWNAEHLLYIRLSIETRCCLFTRKSSNAYLSSKHFHCSQLVPVANLLVNSIRPLTCVMPIVNAKILFIARALLQFVQKINRRILNLIKHHVLVELSFAWMVPVHYQYAHCILCDRANWKDRVMIYVWLLAKKTMEAVCHFTPLAQIRRTHSTYHVSPDELWLRSFLWTL